jgi:alpha-L-fucosidase
MHAAKRTQIEAYKDLKYGMFIHWGLYALLAGEWHGKRIEEVQRPHVAEWAMRSFEIPRDEYRALTKEFNPVRFSADRWVQLAKDAGMQYLVITSKHHDGFALFHTEASSFNVITFAEPADGMYLVKAFADVSVSDVIGLGCDVTWEQTDAGLKITPVPNSPFHYGRAFRVVLEGE